MKFATLVLGTCFLFSGAFGAPVKGNKIAGTYNLYLYFGDTSPFLDELTLTVDQKGVVHGKLRVPNDFDAELEGMQVTNGTFGVEKLSFFVALPEKYHLTLARRLEYELRFLPNSPVTVDYDQQFVGFVTAYKTEYRPNYVGSAIGFRKKN